MEQAARVAGIADIDFDPTADPSRDVELGAADPRLAKAPSRASLPVSHRRSVSTFNRSRPGSAADRHPSLPADERASAIDGGDDDENTNNDDEIPWGPSHPCFPHPNPHVPLTSPLYETTRIIRIKRDWMVAGDLAPAFSNLYPEILDPLIPEDRFRALITKLNQTLLATFNPFAPRNWLDIALGVLTGWLWDDAGLASTKRDLAKLEIWLEGWNRDVGAPEGVAVVPLRRTAYLCLDIQIPDPQISLDVTEGAPTERGPSRSETTGTLGRSESRGSQSQSGRGSAGAARRLPRDDGEYGAYPVVPPIPDRYLEESQSRAGLRREGERVATETRRL